MFRNLKAKTLNASSDASFLSSRSVSASSLTTEDLNQDPNTTRYQSVESLTSINESTTSGSNAFGNLEDVIDDLRNQVNKKDVENKKLHRFVKEAEKRINEVVEERDREIASRKALENAYERLEDANEVSTRQLRDKMNAEHRFGNVQLQKELDRLKKDNERLSKKNSSAQDAVAWQNKAESLEKAFTEQMEMQEHNEVQIQKMRDLIKTKDDELQALESKFDETEEKYRTIQNSSVSQEDSADPGSGTLSSEEVDTLKWKSAQAQQEVETLERQVVKLEIELEDYKQKASDRDFRITRLREDIKNKDLVIDTQKCDALELANALDRTSNQLTDARTELEATKNSYTKSLTDLQGDIDSITCQYRDCRMDMKRQTDLVEQLQIAASATKTLKTNLQEDVETWKGKFEESQSGVAQYEEAAKEHEQVVESLKLILEKQDTSLAQVELLQQEIAAAQQNEEELKQENDYLTGARDSWIQERDDLEEDYKRQVANLTDRNRGLSEELSHLRQSNNPNVLPISSSLQAKFGKSVTEVDIATRREAELELGEMRVKFAELEAELSNKTKQLKQNQQHLSDLKKTLQDELRGGSNISPSASRNSPAVSRKRPESPAFSRKHNELAILSEQCFNGNNSHDLSDDINRDYLKHCVIKYMCSLDKDTSYLVRVISVLLGFSKEEISIVQDALSYRASWFSHPPQSLKKLNSTRRGKK